MSVLGCVPCAGRTGKVRDCEVEVPFADVDRYMGPGGEAWCRDCAASRRYPWTGDDAVYDGLEPLPIGVVIA